jgi:hypothetical protein
VSIPRNRVAYPERKQATIAKAASFAFKVATIPRTSFIVDSKLRRSTLILEAWVSLHL